MSHSRARSRNNRSASIVKLRPVVERLEDRLALSAIAGDGFPVIDFSVDTAWNSGYTGSVSIVNDEPHDIDGWDLEFDLAADISSIWNATIASIEGDHYTIHNASWNGMIASGASVAFGFVAAGDAADVPVGYVFNEMTGGNPPSEPALSMADVTVGEGDGGHVEAVLTATLSAAAGQTVTVGYHTVDVSAQAGNDYGAVEGALVFAPGELQKTITVSVFGDTATESDETFHVELTGAVGATIQAGRATVTILDNDPVATDGAVEFEVTADWQTGFTGRITINNRGPAVLDGWQLEFDFEGDIPSSAIWNASIVAHDGNHYVVGPAAWNTGIAPGGSVSFGFNGTRPTESTVPTNILLNGVPIDGGSEPSLPMVSIRDTSLTEGDSGTVPAVFDVYLSEPAAEPVTVHFSTADGTAQAGDDFQTTGGAVTFDVGETLQTVSVAVIGDTAGEQNEIFYVHLTAAVGAELGNAQAAATIRDDDLPEDPGDGEHRVLAYFAEWGIYARDYKPADIPAESLTHVVYAFANLTPEGDVVFFDQWAATEKMFPGDTWDQPLKGNFNQLQILKEQHPHLRTMIAIGGWTLSGNFSDAVLTEQSREHFAESAVEFAVRYGFDGVDLDWEYPVAGGLASNTYRHQDAENYTLFVAELREQFDEQTLIDGRRYEISVASPAGFEKMENFELAAMSQHVDWFNVMTYDYHGSWESTTNHQAPLYTSPDDSSWLASQYNIDWTIRAYLDAGVPAGKINLGVPLYERGWQGVGTANNGLYQTSTGAAPGTWEAGMFDYWDVHARLEEQPDLYTRHWDDAAKVPYVYSPLDGGTFITYEDPQSVQHKIDYVMEHDLGGMFFWELSGDVRDPENPDSLIALAADQLLVVWP